MPFRRNRVDTPQAAVSAPDMGKKTFDGAFGQTELPLDWENRTGTFLAGRDLEAALPTHPRTSLALQRVSRPKRSTLSDVLLPLIAGVFVGVFLASGDSLRRPRRRTLSGSLICKKQWRLRLTASYTSALGGSCAGSCAYCIQREAQKPPRLLDKCVKTPSFQRR